jgi:transposase
MQLGIKKICSEHGISTTTFYRWIQQERKSSLEPLSRKPKKYGNKLDDSIRNALIQLWKKHPHLSANKIHKLCLAEGHSISYNTVNKLINEEISSIRHEENKLRSIITEMTN